MPRPNPSPQWPEPATSGAAVAVSRIFLALAPGGGYGLTTLPLEADASFALDDAGIGVDTATTLSEGVRAAKVGGRVLVYTL